jgi:hypothetical protein
MRGGEEVPVPVGGPCEDFTERQGARFRRVLLRLDPHVLAGVPHEENGDQESEHELPGRTVRLASRCR